MTHDAPIYTLAEALARTYGEHDPRHVDAIRVVTALLDHRVLAAIAYRTHLDTATIVEHLVAMAELCTATKEKT